jgi:hypothetical protein
MTDLDRACPHPDFAAVVAVHRLIDEGEAVPHGYIADVKVTCVACDEPFRWTGLPAGVLPNRPTCSIDELELRAPLRPASADPDFGLGLPGFAIGWRRG